MTEPNTTNQSRSKGKSFVRLLLLGLAMTFLLANDGCPVVQPERGCPTLEIRLEPGTCQAFSNPCESDFQWAHFPDTDEIKLKTIGLQELIAAEGIYLDEARTTTQTFRSICAKSGVPSHEAFDLPFLYAKTNEPLALGGFRLTVAARLAVVVTASKMNVAPGEHVQLHATVSGGIPPYSVFWEPNIYLDSFRLIATPQVTTTFIVGATDDAENYQTATGQITIVVIPPITVTANPAEINAGEESQLNAIVEGGSPPYRYSWVPADTLNDPNSSAPIARPTGTTRYQVNVTDALGAVRAGTVQVVVRFEAQASASPTSITAGGTSQLDVTASGGFPPYTYLWSPAASLSNATIRNPIASPANSTTYNVTVTDAAGVSLARTAAVEVNAPPAPLTASFTYRIGAGPSLQVDASASTGNIVSYRWELSWTSLSPDLITPSPTASFPIREIDSGTITLTVTDAAGNTATTLQPF